MKQTGMVHDESVTMDSDTLEKERGITIYLDFASSIFVHADSFLGSIRNLFPPYLCHDH
jgi:translation elongation factor EF-G